MPTLFVLSHTPHSDPNEGKKFALAREGDAVILMEDAVYAAGRAENPLSPFIRDAADRGIRFYVLESDLAARGLQTALPTVDYAGFVQLIAEHERAVH